MEKLLGLDELEKVPVESVTVNAPIETSAPHLVYPNESNNLTENILVNSSPVETNNLKNLSNNILNLKHVEKELEDETSIIFGFRP